MQCQWTGLHNLKVLTWSRYFLLVCWGWLRMRSDPPPRGA